jgi:dihydropteroate synthase
MQYHEAASWLFDLRRYSPRTGVEHTRALLDTLGTPDADLRCVQVAGSNGKGSTARMLERVLREAGLDVGLYTSPHLDDVRERVRVNGRKMPKSAVCEFVEQVDDYVTERGGTDASPTFFETVTAMALWEFARQDVDVAVLEVGIGGRYDATSAVDPEASAVTSVTLEHADLLGDTEAEIARDKAQVAADANPLVTATTGEALAAIEDEVDDVYRVGGDDAELTATYEGRDGLEAVVSLATDDWTVETRLPLLGEHQAQNAGVAAALAWQLAGVSDADLERGLRNAHWPGRFEVFDRDPLVVLDGAHNPGACAGLADVLEEFDYDDLHLVFGAMSDKDLTGMATALPETAVAYTCRPDFDRAERPEVLAESLADHAEEVVVGEAVADALDTALAAADPGDAVLVTGSLFVVAAARRRWTAVDVPKQVPDVETAEAVLRDADVPERGVWQLRREGVHRVVRSRVQPRQAARLKQELLAVGGACATSGLADQDRELVDVVLTGTLAQFDRLVDALAGQPHGLDPLGERLREALGIRTESDTRGYPWEDHTAVMGILNVTPDSFHDGGEYDAVGAAVARAEQLVADGADVLDVGGESTRPGADVIPVEEEIERVVPVVERLADLDVLVSIDTRKAAVARAALDAGADVLNDVSGLEDPEMRLVAAEYDVPVVVMHSIETPVDPSTEVEYDDVVEDTIDALVERVLLAEKAGLDRSQIIVDPGLGFGKTRRENFELLGRLDEFHALGCPVLVGHSHKSMFDLLGYDADDRLHATVGASAVAAERGADIVRVHDVAENAAAIRTAEAAADPDGV